MSAPEQALDNGQGIRQGLARPCGGADADVMHPAVPPRCDAPGCCLDRIELHKAICMQLHLHQILEHMPVPAAMPQWSA